MSELDVTELDLPFLRNDEYDEVKANTKGTKLNLSALSDKTYNAVKAARESKQVKEGAKNADYTGGSKLQSAIAGAGSGATLGFSDELYGALQAGKGALANKSLEGLGENYRKGREEYRDYEEQARKANPNSYLAGELVGGIAPTAALPAGAFAKGAGLAERALAGAKAGAVTGAITGLGSSQADITQGDVGGAARDVALGAGSGAAFGAAGNQIEAGANKLGLALRGKALNEGQRSLRLSDAELAKLPEAQKKQMSETLLDYLGPTGSFNEKKFLADKSNAAGNVGAAKQDIINATKGETIDLKPVIQNLRDKAEQLSKSGANEDVAKAYNKYANLLEERSEKGDTVQEAFDRIKAFQDKAYKNKGLIQSDATDKLVQQDVRRELKQNTLGQLDQFSPDAKPGIEKLKEADTEFKKLADLDKKTHLIKKREELEGGLSRITAGVVAPVLGAAGLGAVGTYAGGAEAGAAGTAVGLLAHLAMKRKNPAMAFYADRASKLLQSNTSKEVARALEESAKAGILPFVRKVEELTGEKYSGQQ